MFPIILIGSKSECDLYIEDFIKSHHISSYNIISLNEKIKISDVREIQKKLFLKYEKDEKRILIFRNSITHDAQHALLKTLEEIPDSVYIIIVSQNREDFLPTILSRCRVVKLNQALNTDNNLEQELAPFYEKPSTLANTIILASQLENKFKEMEKDQIIIALEQTLRNLMIQAASNNKHQLTKKYVTSLGKCLELHPLIVNNNVNTNLALTHILSDIA